MDDHNQILESLKAISTTLKLKRDELNNLANLELPKSEDIQLIVEKINNQISLLNLIKLENFTGKFDALTVCSELVLRSLTELGLSTKRNNESIHQENLKNTKQIETLVDASSKISYKIDIIKDDQKMRIIKSKDDQKKYESLVFQISDKISELQDTIETLSNKIYQGILTEIKSSQEDIFRENLEISQQMEGQLAIWGSELKYEILCLQDTEVKDNIISLKDSVYEYIKNSLNDNKKILLTQESIFERSKAIQVKSEETILQTISSQILSSESKTNQYIQKILQKIEYQEVQINKINNIDKQLKIITIINILFVVSILVFILLRK